MRESGHDATHRFDDRTADFVSVDLNSLLYKYETDFAELIEKEFGGKVPGLDGKSGEAAFWRQQAARRREAMLALMWDDQRGYLKPPSVLSLWQIRQLPNWQCRFFVYILILYGCT